MFRTVPLSIIRSFFTLNTAMVYVIQVCWQLANRIRTFRRNFLILLASCQQTCMTYTIAVSTVKNVWWWTEELSEICRVLFQKLIWEISASIWFYCKNLIFHICTLVVCFLYILRTTPHWRWQQKVAETRRKFSTCQLNPHACTCWFYSNTKFYLILNYLCKIRLHMPLRADQVPKFAKVEKKIR